MKATIIDKSVHHVTANVENCPKVAGVADKTALLQVKTINGAVLQKLDIAASNGVVHIVDRVLYPTTRGNLVQTLESDPGQRFTTFLKALKATRLDRDISDYSSKLPNI